VASPARKTETLRLLEKDFVRSCGSLREDGDLEQNGLSLSRGFTADGCFSSLKLAGFKLLIRS